MELHLRKRSSEGPPDIPVDIAKINSHRLVSFHISWVTMDDLCSSSIQRPTFPPLSWRFPGQQVGKVSKNHAPILPSYRPPDVP